MATQVALRRFQTKKKDVKSNVKVEETLMQQKKNYQRHLRNLQKKIRSQVIEGPSSNQPTVSKYLEKRRKCFGIVSSSSSQEERRPVGDDKERFPVLMPCPPSAHPVQFITPSIPVTHYFPSIVPFPFLSSHMLPSFARINYTNSLLKKPVTKSFSMESILKKS